LGSGSQPVGDFYDLLGKVEESSAGYKVQSPDKRRGYVECHPEVRYAKAMRSIASKVSDLSAARKPPFNRTGSPQRRSRSACSLSTNRCRPSPALP
jgi:hypothetical protein